MTEPKLLTPSEIAEELGVSEHLVRLAVANLRDRITWQAGMRGGKRDARIRAYGPEAVEAIRRYVKKEQLRRERRTHEAATYWQGLGRLRLVGVNLGVASRELKTLYRLLRKNSPTVSAQISTLAEPELALVHPIQVLISPLRHLYWRASLAEVRLTGDGKTYDEALLALRGEILRVYRELREAPEKDPERWNVLDQLIRPRRPRKAWKLAGASAPADSGTTHARPPAGAGAFDSRCTDTSERAEEILEELGFGEKPERAR